MRKDEQKYNEIGLLLLTPSVQDHSEYFISSLGERFGWL